MELPIPNKEEIYKLARYFDDPRAGEVVEKREIRDILNTAHYLGPCIFPCARTITSADYGHNLMIEVEYDDYEKTTYFFDTNGRLLEIDEFYTPADYSINEQSTYRFYYDERGRIKHQKTRNIIYGENEFIDTIFNYTDGSNLVDITDRVLDEEGTVLEEIHRTLTIDQNANS